jgi:hypothetical protein
MLRRLFPRQFDNAFAGHPLAIGLLVPILFLRLLQGVNCILRPAAIATSADAIPLDRFAPDAAAVVILLFSLSALSFLMFALQGMVVLWRYRSMIPLLYLWLIVDTLARRALNLAHPTVESGPPGAHSIGFYVNLCLLLVMVVGFALSLVDSRKRSEKPAVAPSVD